MRNIILLILVWNSLLFGFDKYDKLYQVSTIDALLAGYYDGDKNVSELKSKGDFGLGTFNGIDGEMVVYEGVIYHVKSDGKVYKADDKNGVPFASVHFFQSEKQDALQNFSTYKLLQNKLDTYKECKNYPCAFKIEGFFDFMKVRAAPKANKPYPPLAEHIKQTQKFFEAKAIRGTLIGYYLPKYFAKLNVPGYHFHFLSSDKNFGGHVLELSLKDGVVEIDKLFNIEVSLLQTDNFEKGNLKVGENDLEMVEKDSIKK